MRTEIINTGTELLTGQTKNSHAVYLAEQLMKQGIRVTKTTVVGDDGELIKSVVREALTVADLLIITGGLGPTADDITKECVAELLELPLTLHEGTLDKIKAYFAARNMTMPENNTKQALVPSGAIVVENKVGTAPGLIIEHQESTLVILPGPPWELQPMVTEGILPFLRDKGLAGEPVRQKIFKIWGIGESAVQQLMNDIHQSAGKIEIGYQAHRGEVWFKLLANSSEVSAQEMDDLAAIVTARLGDHLWGFADDTLESVVAKLLVQNQLKLSVAESCTGGLIAKKLTDLPGSSEYLMYGVVSYSNEAKMKLLGVKPETLEKYGAVSEQTAMEMAQGVREIGQTDVAVSVTGIAGPGGGSKEKPVGLVYIGVAGKDKVYAKKVVYSGDRENIREVTARAALNLVRLYIQNK